MKLRSLDLYRADKYKPVKEGSRVAEYEKMLHNNESWGIMSQKRLNTTHCLGYLWPDPGKMQTYIKQ